MSDNLEYIQGNRNRFQSFDEYSYTNAYSVDIEELDIPEIIIENLEFKNVKGKEPVFIPGTWFLAPRYMPYYHVVVDNIMYYEYLKLRHPELKMGQVHTQISKEIDEGLQDPFYYLIDYWKFNDLDFVVDKQKDNYIFEKVVFLPNHAVWFDDRVVPFPFQAKFAHYGFQRLHDPRAVIVKKTRDVLLSKVNTSIGPDKVYASRVPTVSFKIRERMEGPDQIAEKRSRVYEEEPVIIEYFKSRGYTIVDNSALGLWEQIEMYANASSIAGISGSNIFNGIWSRPGTNIYEIHTTPFWSYTFLNYNSALGQNNISIARNEAVHLEWDPDIKVDINIITKELDQLKL
jgi:hypothetical protein